MPIQKVFLTSDGAQHTTAARAERHDKRRALREYLRSNLQAQTLWDHDDNSFSDQVSLDEVETLILECGDRLQELAQEYVSIKNTPDYSFDEVRDFTILYVTKQTMKSGCTSPYSADYMEQTVGKVWNAVRHGAVIDGTYSDMHSDMQWEVAQAAVNHFVNGD